MPSLNFSCFPNFILVKFPPTGKFSAKKVNNYLLSKGIQAGIHYPVPVHLQPAYKNRLKLASNMRVTETLSNKIVSLPMYPELSMQEAAEVIKAVKSFSGEQGC